MLAWLERNQFLVLGLSGVILLAGLLYRSLTVDPPPDIVFRDGPLPGEARPVRVHVVGAVAVAGVYDLPAGARVEDAIAAAGGPAEGAALDEINLARRLRDGEQVLVPRRRGASAGAALTAGGKLDLNTATAGELEDLPDIGEALAARIVDSRRVDGPFRSLEDLVARNVLPASTLARIRDYLTVQP